jgi:hypothetical protein
MSHQGIELRTVLPPDLEDILESRIRHKEDPRSLSLEKGVRRDRRAMNELKLPRTFLLEEGADPLQNGAGRVIWGGVHLESPEPFIAQEEEIGEGSPGVHCDQGRHFRAGGRRPYLPSLMRISFTHETHPLLRDIL